MERLWKMAALLALALPTVAIRAAEAPVPPEARAQTEAERKAFAPGDKSPLAVINAFNQMAFFDRKPLDAFQRYLSEDFIERSPDFARDGHGSDKEGLLAFFATRGWNPGEAMTDTIYQIIAEGEKVVVFHKVTMKEGDRSTAFVDIFRVRDGLIVEHWAVGQPVPENVTARHSMF